MDKHLPNEKESGQMKNLLIRVWEILRGLGSDRPLSVEDIREILIEQDRAAGFCDDEKKDKYNPRLLRANIKAINTALESPRPNFAVTKQNDPERALRLKSKTSDDRAKDTDGLPAEQIEKCFVGRREDKECLYYNRDALTYEELRFLFDAVQSAAFLSQDKADDICRKLTRLCGEVDKQLWRERTVPRQGVPFSDKVFESIRMIEQAMARKKRLRFMYYCKEYNDLMRDAEVVDPIAVIYDKGYYYLYGYSYISNGYCALRVDRMTNIVVADEDSAYAEARESFLAADDNVKEQMLLRK